VGEALIWGLLAGAALALGGVLPLMVDLSDRLVGLLLGLGAGALISAVAYELIGEATAAAGGSGRVATGLAIGAVLSFLVATRVDRGGQSTGSVLPSIVISAVPESVIIVGGLLVGHGIDVAIIAAVALCSLPEAVAATERLQKAGAPVRHIVQIWIGMASLAGVTAAAGYALLDHAPPHTTSFVLALAGGVVLAQLVAVMIPEAYRRSGRSIGLTAVFGFCLSVALVGLA
jgi:zinc transporter, ZIP family